MNECTAKAYEAAETELKDVFRQIETRLYDDPPAKKVFVASQTAWVAFRDAECAFRTIATTGGSIHPTMQAMCLEELTSVRTETLKSYLNCEEGDLTCPVPPG